MKPRMHSDISWLGTGSDSEVGGSVYSIFWNVVDSSWLFSILSTILIRSKALKRGRIKLGQNFEQNSDWSLKVIDLFASKNEQQLVLYFSSKKVFSKEWVVHKLFLDNLVQFCQSYITNILIKTNNTGKDMCIWDVNTKLYLRSNFLFLITLKTG